MRIAFFEAREWEKAYLQERLASDGAVFIDGVLKHKHLEKLRDAECLSCFIYSKVTAEVLSALPVLKMITTRSTGYDHIDVAACRKHKIAVCNVPYYGENTVAEHTFALILMLSRKVHKAHAQVQQGQINLETLTGFDLQGKTIGVIGAGRIGLHIIRIARGFGMEVLAYDIHRDAFLADLMGFKYVSLDWLLADSDIVTLHCPLTPSTRHLMNRQRLWQMKQGALLINTARGPLVDTEVLAEALAAGQLSGAGLDVIEGEELTKEDQQLLSRGGHFEDMLMAVRNRKLLARDDVIFTPHNAFNSCEAILRILDTTLANLEAYREGKPVNLVS